MKATLLLPIVFAATLQMSSVATLAENPTDQLTGTWSGSWIPVGGVRDAITVEFKKDDNGKLTGKFLTPHPMTFNKLSFNPKTRTVAFEAMDEGSAKLFTVNAKVQGTELTGKLTANEVSGDLHLIKWTYVPRIGAY